MSNKFFYLTFIPLSFLGFVDASYLAIKHFAGTPLPCSVLRGCEEVMGSQYSVIGGIPVALFGAIYYLAIFVLIFSYLNGRISNNGLGKGIREDRYKLLIFVAHLTIIGFLASLWFIYLQIFVIKAICLYCMFSAFTSITLFVFGIIVLKFNRKFFNQ